MTEKPTRANDVILQTVTKVAVFVIMAFSIYLYLAGHNEPGGGFIGGLMTASAMVLLFLAFDFDWIRTVIPVNFHHLIGIGLLFSLGTGIGSLFFGQPFLTHTFSHVHIPYFGDVELASALIFDTGVYLTVVGVTMSILLTMGRDE